jgi:ActR/RegA family two-component response regulator
MSAPPPVRLLIVDDEDSQREFLIRKAREAGYVDITAVPSAAAALDKIGTEYFDVALVDVVLTKPPPGSNQYLEDGLEIVLKLRTRQPLCRVIAVTTKLDVRAGPRAIEQGAHDYVCARAMADEVDWPKLLLSRLRLWYEVAKGKPKPDQQSPVALVGA